MIKNYLGLLFLLPFLVSCNNKLDVNAQWQDITVVYGLLNQNDSVHYFRITKAFLGPGDAMQFAKIPDSSYYPNLLNVTMEEWEITSPYDSSLIRTIPFDTTTISNKEEGDSVFYYPYQKVYYFLGKIKPDYVYKLKIVNPKTTKVVSGRTSLIGPLNIETPKAGNKAAILPQKEIPLKFKSAVNGRRYQLVLRFNYREYPLTDTTHPVEKSVEWQVFNNVLASKLDGGEDISPYYPGDGLYSALKAHIPVDPSVSRHAETVDYLLSVAADDLNTYMDVTAPSTTIVQERPSYTNISNGIGLFSAIYDNTIDSPRHLAVGTVMLDSLRTNHNTYNLGF
jgi:hypothetical protein